MINWAEVKFSDGEPTDTLTGFNYHEFSDTWFILKWPNGNRYAVPANRVSSVDIGKVEE